MNEEDFKEQAKKQTIINAIFSIGTVTGVKGNKITIKVNKNKNLPYLFYEGNLIRNAAAGLSNYLKIYKGFIRIICKVEEDYTVEDRFNKDKSYSSESDKINRFLTLNAFGYYENDKFVYGIKEMPMLGSECRLLSGEEFTELHQLAKKNELKITIGSLSDQDTMNIDLSVQKIFAGHLGIFGNTGSGKSNTLAKIYTELFKLNDDGKISTGKSKFIFIDFNGEYSEENIFTNKKKVYNLSTHEENEEDKIPFKENFFLDTELLSILVDATDKTQKPFLNRVINLYKKITQRKNESGVYFKDYLKKNAIKILKTNKHDLQSICIDWYMEILTFSSSKIELSFSIPQLHYGDLAITTDYPITGLESLDKYKYKYKIAEINDDDLNNLDFVKAVENFSLPKNIVNNFLVFICLQLLNDLLNTKAINEHISPVIARFKKLGGDLKKVTTEKYNPDNNQNIMVINLKKCSTEIKKKLPLIILKHAYDEEKNNDDSSLHIIIDEAHNILSQSSNREAETWKDYRLEVFEEIIKEGRKFGVFMTIASQRPSDISPTIISQLHNFIIHRLVNEKDLEAIEKFVSYLDKLSTSTIPNLSTGCCFIAGLMAQFPLSIKVAALQESQQPKSATINLEKLWRI